MLRRLLLTTFALLVLGLGSSRTALAHNSLASSMPADGETVTAPPADTVLTFDKDVPLDTLTVTLTDPGGVRTQLQGSRHGSSASEVLTPLPALVDGTYSLRWRLVGADGHAITGRVQFTVAVPAAMPAPGIESPSPGTMPPDTAGSAADPTWSTPGWVAWLLRYAAYVAMMAIVGVAVTEALVWRRAASARFLRLIARALWVVVLTASVQLVLLAADIAGTAPWSAWGSLGAAAEHPAGVALVTRVVLAVVAWILFVHARPAVPDIHRDVTILLSLGLLATWSFAGHARSMRWPWIGVPVDVAHHGAAAAWVGGLAIVATATFRARPAGDVAQLLRRFSVLAARAVAVIVATGVVQSIRLVGAPSDLLATTHGRLLLGKLVLLGAMLWFADRNRRLVRDRLEHGAVPGHDATLVRDAVRRELLIGLAIVGVTASLVVSPPAAADETSSRQPSVAAV